ncbi:MAG TPA: hypothetical protein VM146_16540 [Steroidobacteraceae bacterium]|nr:hypothetical protein [Steroidobacteraceae bacterium]
MPTVSTLAADGPRDAGAVSWGAVIAGAVGAAVLSLVLFVLGTGLGLAVASPWGHDGISGTAATVSTIAWVTFVQLAASVLGGYLAGRLRTRWVTVHTHEVFFRDTAHGFLAWGVSTLLMATLLSSAVTATLSTGMKAGGAMAGAAVAGAGHGAAMAAASPDKPGDTSGPMGYFVDTLFRGSQPAAPQPGAPAADKAPEVTRIFANALESGELNQADTQYLAQLVAAQTGISQTEAEQRVTTTFNQLKTKLQQASDKAKQVADEARKASAGLALWLVVSLLIGAFVASLAATFGGRLRDSSVLANP